MGGGGGVVGGRSRYSRDEWDEVRSEDVARGVLVFSNIEAINSRSP